MTITIVYTNTKPAKEEKGVNYIRAKKPMTNQYFEEGKGNYPSKFTPCSH